MGQSISNFTNLVLKTAEKDTLTIDTAELEKQNTERRVEMEKLNPKEIETEAKELARLRKQLFSLKEAAKGYETQVNNTAGTVRLLEERLHATLKNKLDCETSGNMLGARNYDHAAQTLENQLLDTRLQLTRLQRDSAASARQLREWQREFGSRLAELQKIA